MSETLRYGDAGVDLAAARTHTANIAGLLRSNVAGFAGVMAMPPMREPLLVGCTDGIGTKLLLARDLGWIDGLGQDLVAMSVNDLVCTGATPLFFLDYLAVGKLDPDEAKTIVSAIAAACEASGCSLLGGETAEMPGLYAPGHFDLAGFACGAVERDDLLGPDRVVDGDAIIGIASSGLHSNGYSLVRRLIDDGVLVADIERFLAPTRLYTSEMRTLREVGVAVRSAAHITGGGLAENVPRALPDTFEAVLDMSAWQRPSVFDAILETGRVSEDAAFEAFNMGLGMCVVVGQEDAVRAAELVGGSIVGRVRPGGRGVVRA